MASIGSFGRKYDRIDLDFEYFGTTIRVNPAVSKAGLIQFLAEAGDPGQQDEVRQAQIIMYLIRECVAPDDFELFWGIAKRERQDPQEDLMPLCNSIMEAVAAFPTGQSSGSPAGPSTTPQRYEVALPSQDVPDLSPTDLRAIELLGGRPDLQRAVPGVERVIGARAS